MTHIPTERPDYQKLAAEQIRKEVPPGYSEAWYALVAERATTLEQAARIETLTAERDAHKKRADNWEYTDQQRAAQWIKEFEDLRKAHEQALREQAARIETLTAQIEKLKKALRFIRSCSTRFLVE